MSSWFSVVAVAALVAAAGCSSNADDASGGPGGSAGAAGSAGSAGSGGSSGSGGASGAGGGTDGGAGSDAGGSGGGGGAAGAAGDDGGAGTAGDDGGAGAAGDDGGAGAAGDDGGAGAAGDDGGAGAAGDDGGAGAAGDDGGAGAGGSGGSAGAGGSGGAGGSAGTDGGAAGAGGGVTTDAGATCGGFGSTQAACDACFQAKCCAAGDTCAANQQCLDVVDCAYQCAANDQTCLDNCSTQYANGVNDANALFTCVNDSCDMECGQGGALGLACASDGDCGAGMTCAKATDTQMLGGGAANGYCTVDCSSALQQGGTDPCPAVNGVCTAWSSTQAFCMQSCTLGPADAADFSTSKCHGRPEVACTQLYDANNQPASTACLPNCNSDADCASAPGTACDTALKLCVPTASASTGDPLGSHCADNNATTCAGWCQEFGKSGDAGASTFACTELCTLGVACGGATPTGYCVYSAATGSGIGDLGLCAQLCDTTNDCRDKANGATCDTTYASQIGHGYCVY